MTFFRHLRAARLFLRNHPYVEAPTDFWTKEDSASYAAFVNSETGRKLALLSRNLIYQSAVSATQANTNQAYRCGWASGITATFAWQDSFLPKVERKDSAEDGELRADDFEHLRP